MIITKHKASVKRMSLVLQVLPVLVGTFDLLVAIDENQKRTVKLLGPRVSTKFHGNPFSSC